jgi:hypothetical protein
MESKGGLRQAAVEGFDVEPAVPRGLTHHVADQHDEMDSAFGQRVGLHGRAGGESALVSLEDGGMRCCRRKRCVLHVYCDGHRRTTITDESEGISETDG